MKAKRLFLPLALIGLLLTGCGEETKDYSANVYVGAEGSAYQADMGSGASMTYTFLPDGTGTLRMYTPGSMGNDATVDMTYSISNGTEVTTHVDYGYRVSNGSGSFQTTSGGTKTYVSSSGTIYYYIAL